MPLGPQNAITHFPCICCSVDIPNGWEVDSPSVCPPLGDLSIEGGETSPSIGIPLPQCLLTALNSHQLFRYIWLVSHKETCAAYTGSCQKQRCACQRPAQHHEKVMNCDFHDCFSFQLYNIFTATSMERQAILLPAKYIVIQLGHFWYNSDSTMAITRLVIPIQILFCRFCFL